MLMFIYSFIIKLYIRALDLIHTINESLYPFTSLFLLPYTLASDNHHPTLYKFNFLTIFHLLCDIIIYSYVSSIMEYHVFLTTLSIMAFSFIHVITNGTISSFLLLIDTWVVRLFPYLGSCK